MPKEIINDKNYQREVPVLSNDGSVTNGTHIMSTCFLAVGWNKDAADVQLSVRHDDDPDGFESTYLTLDRDGINRLIRSLRKARDQAFGSDA